MNNNPAAILLSGQTPIVNTTGVDMGAIRDEWVKAKNFVYQYTKDSRELSSLVDAVPLSKDNKNPFVGDVTLAGLVRQIPRDSLEQLPVFSAIINGSKISTSAIIATFLLKKYIFNESTFGKGLLSALQIATEEALTLGFSSLICTTGTMYSDFGTTLKLLHHDDLGIEPGITDGNEMSYNYVSTNLTKTRVQKILKGAKGDPDTEWNLQALQRVLDTDPRTHTYSQWEPVTRTNPAGDADGPTYQFVTRKESGPGAVEITFCPECVEDVPLRVLKSKSKFGFPKVLMLVIDPVALNPFGISRVRLASPMQNFMNIYLGNIASMLLLNSAPPIFKRGRFTKPVQLKQKAVWETLDQNASADIKNMDNGALEKFVELADWVTQQIATIMGKGTGSQVQTSKTAPGVKQAQQVEDSSTNQITKIMENFLRQYALSGLDTLLSEQEGQEDLIVDDDTKNKLNNIFMQNNEAIAAANTALLAQPGPGQVPQPLLPLIGDDNKYPMDWDSFYADIEVMETEVMVSVSKDEMEEKKRADAQDMLTVLAQNATALGPGVQTAVQQLTDILMQDIAPDVKPLPIGQSPPTPPPQPGQSAVGGQVHETGDLVKMFGMTADPTLRNAILAAMNLPQVAKALPPELVNPINPVAQTTMTGGSPTPSVPQPGNNLTR